MPNSIQALPLKMAQQFAERAKRGEAASSTSSTYDFYQGRQRITLVGLDPPIGHICRISQEEFNKLKADGIIK